MPHTGLEPRGYFNLENAIWNILSRLYRGIPDKIQVVVAMHRRNEEIRHRYNDGEESIPDLAKLFGLSNARIHQIIHGH